jgi:hypothetical protein
MLETTQLQIPHLFRKLILQESLEQVNDFGGDCLNVMNFISCSVCLSFEQRIGTLDILEVPFSETRDAIEDILYTSLARAV